MGSHGSCDVSNEVKAETAGIGFRVKSGWATFVLLTGPIDSPVLRVNRMIELADPRFPETRQPYHVGMGKLETDATETNRRADIVYRVAKESVTKILAHHRQNDYSIIRACLVVGSQIDPATIANPHIRAHALEGRLFRSAVEQALNAHDIHSGILVERDAYAQAATQLNKSIDDVRQTIQNFGGVTDSPWRAEQKFAALAAWFSLDNALETVSARV